MFEFIKSNDNELKILLSGEIDHHTTSELRPLVDEEILRSSPKVLVLDFSAVTFMDSSGVGLIMGRYRIMHELGGVVRVVNIPSSLRHVMRVSGLNKF
ncbi:MAG: anti-sigma factor antagonist, partial [Oscillospiraceae bacterium]